MHIEEIITEVFDGNPDLFYGMADLSGKLPGNFDGYQSAIVLGRKLDRGIMESIKKGPNITYWNHYKEVNEQLSGLQFSISVLLEKNNISARIINPTLTDENIDAHYSQTLRVEFSHKMAATQAGLGWVGKTALFVSSEFGPRVRLATILIDTPVSNSGTPFVESKCGDCNLCVAKCPAKAATGKLWNTGMDRDDFFNAFKCREMCRELGDKIIGKDKRLCGICVAVCPVGR